MPFLGAVGARLYGSALHTGAMSAAYGAGRMWGGMGATARRTAIGAGAGAGMGLFSDDMSMIGGALMGAGLGRYGGAGAMGGLRAAGAPGLGALGTTRAFGGGFGRGVWGMARADVHGTRMLANRGMNRIRSSLKGWTRGMAPIA